MKAWQKLLVQPSLPIIKAIKIIDQGGARILFVVSAEGRLLGTVTDGDIRRGILRGISLETAIDKVMNKHPRVAQKSDDTESILKIMKQNGIYQMPVVDDEQHITYVHLMDELVASKTRDNVVVLMAGGRGSRLKPLTDDCPKPLLNVGKKPILETIVENFMEYGFRRFYLSVNYKNDMVRKHFGDGSKWNADIRYIQENQKLGTAGALGLLPEKPKDFLLVMNGDLLTKINFNQLIQFHLENRAAATMCIREYDFQVPYGVVRIEDHHIRAIDEKPVHRFFVNAGIYVLEPGVLKQIPKNKHCDMPVLFEKLIARKASVGAFPIREYWLDIGRLDDLERANGDFMTVFN